MELTVLGASPATQNPGGACSSYLVRQGETTLVLDMGSGAFGRLQQHVAPDAVQAVIISHLHADHVLDLIPYRYYLLFQPDDETSRPRLLLPPGGHEKLLALSRLQDPSPAFYSSVFDVVEYVPTRPVTIDELTVTFHTMRHIPHTYGLRIGGTTETARDTAPQTGTLAYSADSAACPGLLDVARDADLFLCENAAASDTEAAVHLTPRQAATHARDAGARRLVLTHRWHRYGLDSAVREAADVFSGPIALAREGETYAVRP